MAERVRAGHEDILAGEELQVIGRHLGDRADALIEKARRTRKLSSEGRIELAMDAGRTIRFGKSGKLTPHMPYMLVFLDQPSLNELPVFGYLFSGAEAEDERPSRQVVIEAIGIVDTRKDYGSSFGVRKVGFSEGDFEKIEKAYSAITDYLETEADG